MKILVDTNLLIEQIAGVAAAGRELNHYSQIAVSRIVWIEFLVGARNSEEESYRLSVLRDLEVVEVDQEVAMEAVRIRRDTQLQLADSIILATARVHDLLLVTRNKRHFSPRDPNVRIPY